MQSNVQADNVYFWGQELAIHSLAAQKPEACITGAEWDQVVQFTVGETIALPLLLPDSIDYPGMIAQVVRLRQGRRPASVTSKAQPAITLRPTNDADMGFLLQLYASTRITEKELVGWDDEQWNGFIKRLFDLQHTQYQQNYRNPCFDLILLEGMPIGRLYLNRGEQEIRVIDISILPEYRGKGIGGRLLETLNHEADNTGLPVTLYVEKFNPALHLYQRLGFAIEADCGVQWFMVRHS